jgi:hypothetical protein
VGGLTQIVLQRGVRQILIGICQLVWGLLGQVEAAVSLGLLHLLHVVVRLHLVCVIVVVLPSSLLILGCSQLLLPVLLVLKCRINPDLIVEHRLVFPMLHAHLFVLTGVISDLDWRLPQVGVWDDWAALLGLKDHSVRVLMTLVDIERVLQGLSELRGVLACVFLVVTLRPQVRILHLLQVWNGGGSIREETLGGCLVETALIAQIRNAWAIRLVIEPLPGLLLWDGVTRGVVRGREVVLQVLLVLEITLDDSSSLWLFTRSQAAGSAGIIALANGHSLQWLIRSLRVVILAEGLIILVWVAVDQLFWLRCLELLRKSVVLLVSTQLLHVLLGSFVVGHHLINLALL